MTAHLTALCFGARDPARLAGFWGGVLDRPVGDDAVTVLPAEPTDLAIRFVPFDGPRAGPNQIHFDLTSSSLDDQQAVVARALELGGRHLDVGQLPGEEHVVLADLEGNEFCVIEPGNNFLAGTGRIGALSGDGSEAVGRFWSAALDWPLVWDQDEETAIQSPAGGSKITWGGPPVRVKQGRNRLHLELATAGDLRAESDRLVALGARPGGDAGVPGRVDLLDPDGNELSIVTV